MKAKRIVGALGMVLASVVSLNCLADASEPTLEGRTSPREAQLLQLLEQSEQKARAESAKNNGTEQWLPLQPATTPPEGVSMTRTAKSTDEVLKELVREVESLRSRAVVETASTLATQKPKPANRVGSKVTYTYKEGDLYQVHAGVDRVTDVELQPGESLTNTPVAGDTVRWKIGIVKSGTGRKETTHVIVKPLDIDLETNLLLTTDKHAGRPV